MAKILIILGIAALLGWLFYYLIVSSQKADKKKTKKAKETISLETIEENLHQTEFDPFILDAENQGDFPLAVRLHYLATLKALNEQKWIEWKRDSTNRKYLRQMRKRPNFDSFRTLTTTFEKIWYGEYPITKEGYEQLKTQFISFKKTIS